MALRRVSFTTHPQSDQAYTPPGSMDKRITLMNPSTTGSGGVTIPGDAFAETWACIRGLFAQEKREAQQIVKEVIYEVIFPYLDGTSEAMTIQWEDITLQIQGIIDFDGQHRELRALCVARDQNP